jgi:hypothetical protein
MLSADQIRTQCLRKYHEYLRSILTTDAFFPLEIRFGRPSTTAQWDELQRDITQLVRENPGYQIEWKEINTRKWGRQRLPARVWFSNDAEYLRAISKTAETVRFRNNTQLVLKEFPQIREWFTSNISKTLDYADAWPQLLEVCRYFYKNPRPARYARELPMPVGTKFIETHQPILRSLLDFLLPKEAIDASSDHFETRFGLRYDEPLVRLRILDQSVKEELHLPATDISLPHSQFHALDWKDWNILITENKMTFLTLPNFQNTIALWGMGNAAALLEKVSWLANCRLYYWGDLDVHGFHILSRLRRAFLPVKSVMMDDLTLTSFESYWQAAGESSYEETQNLTIEERQTYIGLRDSKKLLKQERIAPDYSKQRLREVIHHA